MRHRYQEDHRRRHSREWDEEVSNPHHEQSRFLRLASRLIEEVIDVEASRDEDAREVEVEEAGEG
jgi:hypothetical protein|tara:strand:- start:2556 stop:2750 length:195 start_codon:yes stop_codon:yes gene_type:complete